MTLSSEAKATLLFAQPGTDAPWTAAIKIHCGQTTCDGFAVRFEGPVRWDQRGQLRAGGGRHTDSKDQAHPELKVNIVLTRLDLEGPAAAEPRSGPRGGEADPADQCSRRNGGGQYSFGEGRSSSSTGLGGLSTMISGHAPW